MNISFVNMTYQMKPGFNATLGLDGIQVGAGPGTMVDLLTARGISMRFK